MNKSNSQDPLVLGKRLQEARKLLKLTQQWVADHLKIARTTLTAIEKGERVIRPDELVQLAQLYNEPINRLLRQEIQGDSLIVQFRRVLSENDGQEVEQAIHEFQKLCEDYVYLESLTNSPIPKKYPSVYEISGFDPYRRAEDIATEERNRLGLGDGTIVDFEKILENEIGIRIFAMPFPSKFAGLFAYSENIGACIAINSKHPTDRQLMSLIHEYAHFLTRRMKADILVLMKSTTERFAEAFARYFLMPSTGLQRRFHEIKLMKNGEITPADLLRLADLYSVSFQALVLRLEELKLLPKGTCDNLITQRFQVRKAQNLLDISPKSGTGEMDLPYRYRAMAVQAWNAGKLSEGQLAKILRTNRVHAREIIDKFIDRDTINEHGEELSLMFEDLSKPI